MEEQTVTISLKEYLELQKDSLKLQALEEAGVDNWSGYPNAMDLLEQYEDY